jgi:hypothetical protein
MVLLASFSTERRGILESSVSSEKDPSADIKTK